MSCAAADMESLKKTYPWQSKVSQLQVQATTIMPLVVFAPALTLCSASVPLSLSHTLSLLPCLSCTFALLLAAGCLSSFARLYSICGAHKAKAKLVSKLQAAQKLNSAAGGSKSSSNGSRHSHHSHQPHLEQLSWADRMCDSLLNWVCCVPWQPQDWTLPSHTAL